MTTVKLTSEQSAMLEGLKDGPELAGRWDFSGSRAPGQLIRKGLIERCKHATVRDGWGFRASAYTLTDAGRAALKERKP